VNRRGGAARVMKSRTNHNASRVAAGSRRKTRAPSGAKPQPSAARNIREICEMERAALRKRSLAQRWGDFIVHNASQLWFLLIHVVWFTLWTVVNAIPFGGIEPFDPFPFPFLTLVVSLEAIFLSLFILNSQNRESHQAEQRAQLDLQINLLAELESTKILRMLHALCEHYGLGPAKDPEIQQLMKRTEPKELVNELRSRLPNSLET
jgi:uncharacterized membrane protein